MNKLIITFLAILVFTSCEESSLGESTASLTVSDLNLTPLPDGYTYQGWLLLNGTFVSVGNLTAVAGVQQIENVNNQDLADADAFAITIEPTASSLAPSDFVYMVGDFSGNSATLATNFTTSAGVSTSGANSQASFSMHSPTSASATDDEYGLWFYSNENGTDTSLLNLNFGNDFKYRAWLEKELNDGNTYAFYIGDISTNAGSDTSALFTTNTTAIPAFAGEDFLSEPSTINYPDQNFPLDVRGGRVFITVAPEDYSSTSIPFSVGILEHNIAPAAITGIANTLNLEPTINTTNPTVNR